MDRFVIEIFSEGEFLYDEAVECDQRLLNEHDLGIICTGKDVGMLFVRRLQDPGAGYFLKEDGRWDYGQREEALSVIKRRI